MVEVTLELKQMKLFKLTHPVWQTLQNEINRITGLQLLKDARMPKDLSDISFWVSEELFDFLKSKKIFLKNTVVCFNRKSMREFPQENCSESQSRRSNRKKIKDKAGNIQNFEKKEAKIINRKKVYISNIPSFITDDLITSIFEQFGPVRKAYVCTSKRKGKFLYGFASFYDEDSVDRCLKSDLVDYKGYKMAVKIAAEREDELPKKKKHSRMNNNQMPERRNSNSNHQDVEQNNFENVNQPRRIGNYQENHEEEQNINNWSPNPIHHQSNNQHNQHDQRFHMVANFQTRKNMNPYDRDQLKKGNFVRIGSKLLSKCYDNHSPENIRINSGKKSYFMKKLKKNSFLKKKAAKRNNFDDSAIDFDREGRLKKSLSYFC